MISHFDIWNNNKYEHKCLKMLEIHDQYYF
jgi:hypothetical protein